MNKWIKGDNKHADIIASDLTICGGGDLEEEDTNESYMNQISLMGRLFEVPVIRPGIRDANQLRATFSMITRADLPKPNMPLFNSYHIDAYTPELINKLRHTIQPG